MLNSAHHYPPFSQEGITHHSNVFDCSLHSSTDAPSLNDSLLAGPSLLNDMCSITGYAAVNPRNSNCLWLTFQER